VYGGRPLATDDPLPLAAVVGRASSGDGHLGGRRQGAGTRPPRDPAGNRTATEYRIRWDPSEFPTAEQGRGGGHERHGGRRQISIRITVAPAGCVTAARWSHLLIAEARRSAPTANASGGIPGSGVYSCRQRIQNETALQHSGCFPRALRAKIHPTRRAGSGRYRRGAVRRPGTAFFFSLTSVITARWLGRYL